MPSLGGITEIIGVRAVIIDVRQYLADGREIERVNDRMAASELKLQAASQKASVAQDAARNSAKRALADRQLLIKAINDEFLAEQKLNQARTTNVTGQRGPNGRFLPAGPDPAAIAQAEKELRFQQSLRSFISKGEAQSSRESIAFAGARTAALRTESVALEQQAKLQEQLSAARRSRINAATTGGALVATAAISLTAGASISAAAKYQQELSKINVLTNTTDEETKQLGEQFKQLSTEIPVSAADLAEAAYTALSSGIKSTSEALTLVTQASKAAVAGQGDVKDIVRATIAVLNGYPKGAITASQANDILFAGVKEGAAEFDDFAGSIGKLIPIAAALNVPFDQLTASLAVLTNGGLNAEEAATGLRAILNDLAKDENSKQAQAALKQFGLTVSDLRKKIRDEGLPQAMGELITLFNGNLAAIEPIIPNIRGMVAAFSAFNNNGKTTIGVLSAIDNAGGIVDQSFAKTKDNVANLAKIVQNQLNVALIEIGTAVLPEITKQLQGLIGWISANKDAIAKFVSEGLQVLAQIITDIATGFEALRRGLSDIIGPADSAKVAIAAIGAALIWALPGGPYLKGLALALTLLGEIQKTGIDTPIGHFGGRSKIDELKKEQEDLRNTLKEITNPSGPGGIKGFLNDAAQKLSDLFGTPGATNIGPTAAPEVNQAAKKLAEEKLAEVSRQLAIEEDKEAEKKRLLDEATKPLSQISLPKLTNSVEGVDQAAKKAAEDVKKLAEAFQKSSESAGQVESFTVAFKKFATLTKEQADAFGLSAAQAGAVQGFDAVTNARKREQNEIFNNIEAINAIAEAYRRSAAVGRELLLDLAQASLEASQTALSQVFSRPTREVADLGVPLARQQLITAQFSQRNNPAINALQQQLRNIDKQIAAQNRANQIANRVAQRQRDAQQKAQQAAQKAQERAQQAEADARRLADLQAQIAAERQLAALQKLIDANNKAASDLQKAFIKSNNDLQVQINTAIGKGDSKTALDLVEQQRKATKQYRDQSKAIQDNTDSLTVQKKAAEEAEAERQRQQKLADALFEAQQHQKESTDDVSDSLDAMKDAQDAQTQALEDSKQAIQDQIDALQAPIDASKQQEQAIQDSIAVYEAQTNVLKALGVAADKTLLSQAQQAAAAKYFTDQIGFASGQAQILAKSFYDFIPGAHDADLKFQALTGAIDAVNNKIDTVLNPGFDAAAFHAHLLALAEEDAATTFTKSSGVITQSAQALRDEISKVITAEERILTDISQNNLSYNPPQKIKPPKVGGYAEGGFFTKPTLGIIGEAGPEVLLPLNNAKRIGEILAQASSSSAGAVGTYSLGSSSALFAGNIPSNGYGGNKVPSYGYGGNKVPSNGYGGNNQPSQMVVQLSPQLTAALARANSGQAIFAPNITVTGQTLDTMEATAIRAVQDAFRQARISSGRQGGLITTGLGPNH